MAAKGAALSLACLKQCESGEGDLGNFQGIPERRPISGFRTEKLSSRKTRHQTCLMFASLLYVGYHKNN